jgi:hypothetical protein
MPDGAPQAGRTAQDGLFTLKPVRGQAAMLNAPNWKVRLISPRSPAGGPAVPSLAGHILTSAVIIALGGVLYLSVQSFNENLSRRWHICPIEQELDSRSSARQNGSANQPNPGASALPAAHAISQKPDLVAVYFYINQFDQKTILPGQAGRLISQLKQLEQAQAVACEIGVFFFSHRNAALTVTTAAGILALLSLALVSKNGWEKTSNFYINIGVTSAVVLFAASTFSQLYGQKANYENQRSQYLLATNLLNSVASAVVNRAAVGLTPVADANAPAAKALTPLSSPENVALLIRYLDQNLETINAINFTGDASFAEQSVNRINTIIKSTENVLPKFP